MDRYRNERSISARRASWLVALVVASSLNALAAEPGWQHTLEITVDLYTGGAVTGLLVDTDDRAVVVVHDNIPYAFPWRDIKSASACRVREAALLMEHGPRGDWNARVHLTLGRFALDRGEREQAKRSFANARKLDPAVERDIRQAYRAYNAHCQQRQELYRLEETTLTGKGKTSEPDTPKPASSQAQPRDAGAKPATAVPQQTRQKYHEAYLTFGNKVREVLGDDIELIESDHFLIWTDWAPRRRDLLTSWCEQMYGALCNEFQLDPNEPIFLDKCPVFCFRTEQRFQKFAQYFDGYAGTNAAGYTRSIQENGHVHVVVLRRGTSPEDFDRFACTLVHEGTHAFVHRLFTSQLIPHWVNEGCAEWTTQRVLGARSTAEATAHLLDRQIVRYDWAIDHIIKQTGPLGIHEYPIAYSLVCHLQAAGRDRFTGFLRDLKSGQSVVAALAANFDGLTPGQFEASWRASIRAADPTLQVEEPGLREEPDDTSPESVLMGGRSFDRPTKRD